jgi:HEAT repeat protein
MNSMQALERYRALDLKRADDAQRYVREALATQDVKEAWLTLSRFGNGYVREIAVRALAGYASQQALEALLERLNDWVPQVREQAVLGVERFLVEERAELWLQVLGAVLALAGKGRADHDLTLSKVRRLLVAQQVRPAAQAAFVGSRGKTARFLFELLQDGSQELVELALEHADVSVRQRGVDASAGLPAAQALPLLEKAMSDSAASVRVMVLRRLLTLLQGPREYLRNALLEASPAMRSLARWAAHRWQLDCREVLLARLSAEPAQTRREWLGLIGLVKDLNEVSVDEMIVPAFMSPSPHVRQLVLEALGDRGLALQLRALDDSSAKVFRCAVALLNQQSWAVIDGAVEALLDSQWYALPDDRRRALLGLKPLWRQLEYLLERFARSSSDSAYWLERVSAWCDEQYTLVDPQTPKAVRDALLMQVQQLEGGELLPPGTSRRLH